MYLGFQSLYLIAIGLYLLALAWELLVPAGVAALRAEGVPLSGAAADRLNA
jgi:hypothetical protein